jgi:transmembrane protein EpsG
MEILWINLGFVYISSFFGRYFSKPILGAPFVKPAKLFIFLPMSALVLISGLRNNIGDTYFYMLSYKLMTGKFSDIKFKGDFGFNIYQTFLHHISSNPQILIFVTALITNMLIVISLYKYSRMIELSLFVYIAAGMFMVSMNGIRQCMAAAIIFVATKYILEGKFLKFLLVVLGASFIHQTALILIPTYFIVRRKAWTKTTYLILGLGVLLAACFNQFSNVMFSALSDTQYGHYSDFAAGGASIMRPIIGLVPVIIAYFGRDKLRALWPESDYIVNLALLDVIFLILATKNWLFNRLDIYFGLYQLILISWILSLFIKKQQKAVYLLLIVCYLFFFYYEEVVKQNIQYGSYFLKIH